MSDLADIIKASPNFKTYVLGDDGAKLTPPSRLRVGDSVQMTAPTKDQLTDFADAACEHLIHQLVDEFVSPECDLRADWVYPETEDLDHPGGCVSWNPVWDALKQTLIEQLPRAEKIIWSGWSLSESELATLKAARRRAK